VGVGYFLLLISGFYMGLLGSGGSILTLPLLLYVLHTEESIAVPISLGIVGISSGFGVVVKSIGHHVVWKKAILFALFSMPAGFLGSKIGMKIGTQMQINLFMGLLAFVFIFMFLGKEPNKSLPKSSNVYKSIFTAILIGFITGIVGVGGGFFLIPTFLYREHLDYQDSAGTSLVVISLNSISALLGYSTEIVLPYFDIFIYGMIASLGLLIGNHFSKKVSTNILKKIFSFSLMIIFLITFYHIYIGKGN
jgi:uncharacterized membrane protein YfcA